MYKVLLESHEYIAFEILLEEIVGGAKDFLHNNITRCARN